jgi:hypothetical protein
MNEQKTKEGYRRSEWAAYASLEEVRANFSGLDLPMDQVRFVRGDVKLTLDDPKSLPEKISVPRLDIDCYESTK